jgi:hypothetical protein
MLLLTTPASAAKFLIVSRDAGSASVFISGEIVRGDSDKFKQVIASTGRTDDKILVRLNSDGGVLLDGLSIGEYVRNRGLSTFVPQDAVCSSVCAMIWLAGKYRVVAPKAHIGFHAAYNGTTNEEKGNLNAVVGSYLRDLGMSVGAIWYMTSAAPDEMKWLSKEDADKFGIEYSIYDPNEPKPFAPDYAPPITKDLLDGHAALEPTPKPEPQPPEAFAVQLVKQWLAAWSAGVAPPIMGLHYAQSVDYFGNGMQLEMRQVVGAVTKVTFVSFSLRMCRPFPLFTPKVASARETATNHT